VERVTASTALRHLLSVLFSAERPAAKFFLDFWMFGQVNLISVGMGPDGTRGVRLGVYLVGQ
jgi:hypothetical protein